MDFHIKVPIYFHQVDAGGILFFSEIFKLAHTAYEEFITNELNIPWSEWFSHPDWIVPIKQAQADYMKPFRGGESYDVHLSISDLSISSFKLTFSFSQNGSSYAIVKTTHVFCQRSPIQKIDIPDFIQQKLASWKELRKGK